MADMWCYVYVSHDILILLRQMILYNSEKLHMLDIANGAMWHMIQNWEYHTYWQNNGCITIGINIVKVGIDVMGLISY